VTNGRAKHREMVRMENANEPGLALSDAMCDEANSDIFHLIEKYELSQFCESVNSCVKSIDYYVNMLEEKKGELIRYGKIAEWFEKNGIGSPYKHDGDRSMEFPYLVQSIDCMVRSLRESLQYRNMLSELERITGHVRMSDHIATVRGARQMWAEIRAREESEDAAKSTSADLDATNA